MRQRDLIWLQARHDPMPDLLPDSTPSGTAPDLSRSIMMSDEDSHGESNSALLRDPGFWVAQVLACGLIAISGLVIWYVQS